VATLVNDKGESFDVSDVDAVKMTAADPSLKVQGDLAVSPDQPGQTVTSQNAQRVLSTEGAAPARAADIAADDRHRYLADKTSAVGALGRSAFSGATAGLLDGVFDPETLEADRAIHGTLSTIGTVGGAILPSLVGDAGGLLGLAADPVEAERAAGALSSKFMFGGEAENLTERGLASASSQVEKAKALAGTPEDLTVLDKPGLRAARDTELDTLAASHATDRAAAKSAVVDDVLKYQDAVKDANPYLVTGEGSQSAPFAKSSRTLRNALDDVEGLRESPGTVLKPLRLQAQALEKTIGEREAIAAKFDAANGRIAKDLELELQTLPDAATDVELSGKAAKRYGAYADVKVGKDATVTVARDDAHGFLQALQGGEVQGEGRAAMDRLQGLLDANKDLQTKIKTATLPAIARGELTSERIKAIDAAHDALSTPGAKSTLGEEMLSGSIMGHVAGLFSGMPVIGPMIGAKAGKLATDIVFNRLGKATAASGARSSAAMRGLFDASTRAAPAAAVSATRVLSSMAFAPRQPDAPAPATLADAFHARANEIKSQTYYDATGTARMRPEARDAMAAKLAPIRAANPKLADQLETIKATGFEYLAGILPRRPDFGTPVSGADHWQPSDFAMRSWARSAHAIEDLHGVEERLAAGTITPEDVAAYHAVAPERANALKAEILSQVAKKPVPYQRRIAMSMFTGTPIDPSMHPAVLRALQASFAAEEGSAGGTQAPVASPQFGSIKKSGDLDATPAQKRSQG
jgi:hypothetical protein